MPIIDKEEAKRINRLRRDRIVTGMQQAKYEMHLALIQFNQIDDIDIKIEASSQINATVNEIAKYRIENIPTSTGKKHE